jgi:hypothetical protein
MPQSCRNFAFSSYIKEIGHLFKQITLKAAQSHNSLAIISNKISSQNKLFKIQNAKQKNVDSN